MKLVKPKEESNENSVSKGKATEKKKNKTKKKKRLIVRNLSFKVTKEELQETFSKFGNVLDVNIPLKDDGKKRGFAFIEYEDTKALIKAMKALNNKEIHGRRVAIDFAIDKTSYQLKVQSIKREKDVSPMEKIDREFSADSASESEDEKPNIEDLDDTESVDENERKANEFLRDFESGFETVQNNDSDSDESSNNDSEDAKDEDSNEEDESNEEEDSDEEDDNDEESGNFKKSRNVKKEGDKKSLKEKHSDDVSEGKTVFLRNVSFSTSKESLKEAMEKFGECEYCVICVDPFTDHSKGTAFVKYKNKDSADKLIQESLNEPGVLVDGRKLLCSLAISRKNILDQSNKQKTPKDKRNLNLLKVGLIMPNTPESEGVSVPDMKKRAQLEMIKRQKLKNVNFFVSDTRLMIHNLPKTMTDLELRKLFKKVVGKGAVITEARVMKEFKKTNSEGIPLSKGFGFVSFRKQEDALKAVTELNNNPTIFSNQKRPIVEFAIENRVALQSKERRKERMQQRNKKRMEEKLERQANEQSKNLQGTSKRSKKRKRSKANAESRKSAAIDDNNIKKEDIHAKSKKSKTRKGSEVNTASRKSTVIDDNNIEKEDVYAKSKKKHKKKSPKKSNNKNLPSQQNFTDMVNKFKEKLINKI